MVLGVLGVRSVRGVFDLDPEPPEFYLIFSLEVFLSLPVLLSLADCFSWISCKLDVLSFRSMNLGLVPVLGVAKGGFRAATSRGGLRATASIAEALFLGGVLSVGSGLSTFLRLFFS